MDAAHSAKTAAASPTSRRVPNGLAYREVGRGQPVLLLHGLMAGGEMFDPLVERGTVAQELARTRPQAVAGMFLTYTYDCNALTVRERIEGLILLAVHTSSVRVRSPRSSCAGPTLGSMTAEQQHGYAASSPRTVDRQMRGAVRDGLLGFDSRPWLNDIVVPTLVIGGSADRAVPRHHFDMLASSIPGARAREVDGAGHALIWTHTSQLANIIRNQAAAWVGAGTRA